MLKGWLGTGLVGTGARPHEGRSEVDGCRPPDGEENRAQVLVTLTALEQQGPLLLERPFQPPRTASRQSWRLRISE